MTVEEVFLRNSKFLIGVPSQNGAQRGGMTNHREYLPLGRPEQQGHWIAAVSEPPVVCSKATKSYHRLLKNCQVPKIGVGKNLITSFFFPWLFFLRNKKWLVWFRSTVLCQATANMMSGSNASMFTVLCTKKGCCSTARPAKLEALFRTKTQAVGVEEVSRKFCSDLYSKRSQLIGWVW